MKKQKQSVRRAALTTALLIGMTGICSPAFSNPAILEADFTLPATEVSKNLFGIFFEDINYAADGGIYGEMIQNRSFEYANCGRPALEAWEITNESGKSFSSILKTSSSKPLNKNNPVYAEITVKQEGDGISNSGYEGLFFEEGKTYPGSIWLRSPDSKVKSVTIAAGGAKAKSKTESITISGITNEWTKFEFSITAPETVKNGKLGVFADQKGTLDIDFVSLFRADIYKNQPNGLRKDLAEKLEEMHPAFIRFPGGCIVHGSNLENRYEWKNTVGPVEERKEKANFWGYEQSNGLGFYEYFRFCEDIGAEALPVLSCGMAHNGEISSVAEYEKYAQDTLDMIEWATGPADSKWGKIRAEAGHPEPFKLNYVGIGNEDCGQDYLKRFDYIASKVKAKYPQIKTIMSSGFTWNDGNFHDAWNQVRAWENGNKKGKGKKAICDLVDEHYYNEAAWFLTNNQRYDNLDFYPRGKDKAKVFIGEYASWDVGRRNSLYAALTEAAYMTGIERNGDIIEIASYAPLFARQNNVQWFPDAIWFNETECYGTPNYYVQKMYMNNKSDKSVKYTLTQPAGDEESRKKIIGGTVGLGTWATTAQFKNIKITNDTTGEILYESGKTATIDDLQPETGLWSVNKKGVICQDSMEWNVRTLFSEVALGDVENYSFEFDAMKTGGAEGFLVMFGVKGSFLYWWNMGGWGNTRSAIEKGTRDARSIIGNNEALALNTGAWYKIKVEVKGESFKCYLNGNLMHDYTDTLNFDPMYAHVGQTDDGKTLVKIVNVSDKEQEIQIKLNGIKPASTAKATVLTGNKSSAENSFKNPENVIPLEKTVSGISSDFVYKTEPNSFTILELK